MSRKYLDYDVHVLTVKLYMLGICLCKCVWVWVFTSPDILLWPSPLISSVGVKWLGGHCDKEEAERKMIAIEKMWGCIQKWEDNLMKSSTVHDSDSNWTLCCNECRQFKPVYVFRMSQEGEIKNKLFGWRDSERFSKCLHHSCCTSFNHKATKKEKEKIVWYSYPWDTQA